MAESKKEEPNSSTDNKSTKKPLVFISHDTRDAELAEAFSKLLSSVSAGVLKSFRSSDKRGNQGIAYGVEWYPEIMKKLDDASDVVALLTKHSVDRPWILFEAGVAKGKLDTPLLGIAIGIPLNNANNGPFAQFQNSGDDTDSLTKLVVQLVKRIPNSEPDQDVIKIQVESFKKKASEIIAKQAKPKKEETEGELMEDASVAKLFEEIKVMYQDLPSRIERRVIPERMGRRFHPKIMDDLLFMARDMEDQHLGFLMMISIFKDRMPWVYEVGKETYDLLKSSKAKSTKEKALHDFRRMLEHSKHYSLSFSRAGSKEDHMMIKESHYLLYEFIDRFMHNVLK